MLAQVGNQGNVGNRNGYDLRGVDVFFRLSRLFSDLFKTLCFFNYALILRQDYDITSSLRRGALQMLLMVCQYMHAPTENHWSAVKRILRYLHGTAEHGMLIRRSSSSTLQAFTNVLWKGNFDTSLEAFSDADWLEIQMIDAEYKDLADIVVELTWLQALLNELGICSSSTPILWCDNLGNNKGTIDNVYCQLGSAFALKDLRPLNYFLGIEIVSHVSDILLSQKKSILELLQSAGLSNCNLVSSPMLTSSSLSLDDNTAFFNPVIVETKIEKIK
nr:hypothetical protein [Tanacetum cinerariifolium]